eukprot:COSAG06_NODE_8194_length_2243_cov_4.729011_2_plen_104_part_00
MVAHAGLAAIAMAPGPRARPTVAETGLRLQHQVVLARHVQLHHAALLVRTTAHTIAMAPGPRARPTAAETGLRLQHQVVLARHVQLHHSVMLVRTTARRTTQR